MKIVLRQDVDKLGFRGDIVSVADGYARNFLIPKGFAIAATEGIAKQAEAMRQARDRAEAKNREAAQVLATSLGDAKVEIAAKVGAEGKLFGSVTNAEIVASLAEKYRVNLDRKQVELHEPIRMVGDHTVPVKLHSEVSIDVTVSVVSEAEDQGQEKSAKAES